jgi:hypothetical protein
VGLPHAVLRWSRIKANLTHQVERPCHNNTTIDARCFLRSRNRLADRVEGVCRNIQHAGRLRRNRVRFMRCRVVHSNSEHLALHLAHKTAERFNDLGNGPFSFDAKNELPQHRRKLIAQRVSEPTHTLGVM